MSRRRRPHPARRARRVAGVTALGAYAGLTVAVGVAQRAEEANVQTATTPPPDTATDAPAVERLDLSAAATLWTPATSPPATLLVAPTPPPPPSLAATTTTLPRVTVPAPTTTAAPTPTPAPTTAPTTTSPPTTTIAPPTTSVTVPPTTVPPPTTLPTGGS